MASSTVKSVAVIGSHTPRRCGIATFTADLAQSLVQDGLDTRVVAMNDASEGYDYPPIVAAQIHQQDAESYASVSRYLNAWNPDVVCVQHEYGIYGGTAGAHVLGLLRDLHAPIVTTLHTILSDPSPDQRAVLGELMQLSDRVVVMTQRARALLRSQFNIPDSKVVIVPHGIPVVEHPDLSDSAGAAKTLLMTFGLLSPDKGIENMIKAMPAIVDAHPNVEYLIAGVTHPHIRRDRGEDYREGLEKLVEDLGMRDHVRFHNEFLTPEALGELLREASIYVTPYLKREQITSGTLAYAFGCGEAVVSTPYWHAEELLADGRGILVPFHDPGALAAEITELLSNKPRLKRIREAAYEAGLETQWPAIGKRYHRVFEMARESWIGILNAIAPTRLGEGIRLRSWPEMNPSHLMAMTDDTGIFQHAKYSIPNRAEGYCIDDNARAAILAVDLAHHGGFEASLQLQNRYASFLDHAFNRDNGRFRNFLSFERIWLEEAGSEDSHGRAIWACGHLAAKGSSHGIRTLCSRLVQESIGAVDEFTSLRAWCFASFGLAAMLDGNDGHGREHLTRLRDLGERVLSLYKSEATEDWPWFEPVLAYDNARLSQSVITIATALADSEMLNAGLRSLNWLVEIQTDSSGRFLPIGSDGFYRRNGVRANYDQQPLEASATIDACRTAFAATRDPKWKTEAIRAFEWFHGGNSEGLILYDSDSGGCRDGLSRGRVNDNQGAESTLAYLSALTAIQKIADLQPARRAYFG